MPETVAFATKPQIAATLIAAALDAGAPCAWVLADALYGADSRIRRMLEARGQPYALATRSNHHLRFLAREGPVQTDPATLADALPAAAWTPHAAGDGSKGIRLYDWARIALPWTTDAGSLSVLCAVTPSSSAVKGLDGGRRRNQAAAHRKQTHIGRPFVSNCLLCSTLRP